LLYHVTVSDYRDRKNTKKKKQKRKKQQKQLKPEKLKPKKPGEGRYTYTYDTCKFH
jgi:hypothetical protein